MNARTKKKTEDRELINADLLEGLAREREKHVP
jgi:hypothetical protein